MSQKGKAGRDLIQVGRDFIQTWNVQVLLGSKFSKTLILFGVSVVAIAIDRTLIHSEIFSRMAGSSSLTGIVLYPVALFIIGFIPILGGMGFISSLFLLIASLQEPSFLPASLGWLTGVMSGISFRKSLVG